MKIEHIALYVWDLEAARDFFINYFSGTAGAEYHNPSTGFRSYFIAFADGARLELMQKPALPEGTQPKESTGYSHLAFSTGSREAVDTLTRRLSQAGYTVVSGPRTTGDGYYESCILGPEQNRIEITI